MKTIVVLPAYNCEKTLSRTISDIPNYIVDEVILVDDCSSDSTCSLAKSLGIKHIIKHDKNLGYGANQKTCYDNALLNNADIIIMLHPDYQYDPKLIPCIIQKFSEGADIVFGSRFHKGTQAIRNGMPIYKYIFNRALTIFQNLVFNKSLSEYHTGYRAYKKDVLMSIDYHKLSNDFIFDNQFILETFLKGFNILEVYCPAKYEDESSSINLMRSIKYGLGVIYYTFKYKFRS